jgi:dTDP-4-dehydrorhamnose reductase
MRILLLDLDGMLSHVIKPCLENYGYEVFVTSNNPSEANYYEPEKDVYHIKNLLSEIKPDIVVNCIASLIQESEENHPRAILLNSYLPHYLDSLSREFKFKLIHRSTDCIFEGTTGNYTESSTPDAASFYGKTKALGEVNNDRTLTLRVSIIGPDQNKDGDSLFPWFLRQTGEVSGYSEVYWTGVTTLEFARIIDLGIKNQLTGVYNISNGEKTSKYELLQLFAKYYPSKLVITENSTKKSDKSLVANSQFDFQIPNYDEMIKNMREWTDSHLELYPYLRERTK